MVLKLNEYVRTKYGNIVKVVGVQSGGIEKYFFDKEVHNLFNYLNGLVVENVVIKHSFNIAEILEEDDYVNGNKVVKQVSEEDKEPYLVVVVSSKMIKEPLFDYITNNRIKSIVTKEQFKDMEYEVK